jgi:serine O-acetyltransferase
MDEQELNQRLRSAVDKLVESVNEHPNIQHLDHVSFPDREIIIDSVRRLRQIIFPGYLTKQELTRENLSQRIGQLMLEVSGMLFEQVRCCLRYRQQLPAGNDESEQCEECDRMAREIVAAFFDRLPEIRSALAGDVQAAFDGDPAAQSTDETIFCYPGLFAISVQRLAHEFYKLGVPLLPRIMTEHAHSETGIDIHPGAKLGQRFFIDHGTGIVIGETAEIGNNVKIYQGVTLGALAPAYGQLLRGIKRHPTIEDDVIIYAGATILGGDTVIGKAAIINGNVFITSSVPAHTSVSMEAAKLAYRQRRRKPISGDGGSSS